ncbi:MAG TPA: glycosyltransferase family 2 protein [Thermoleophilaceae bacterium]|nr:glycosyltransferase family 2 protein [Thermoleophilaceae bacterium]
MSELMTDGHRNGGAPAALPTVSIVFLVYNRREELRESLRRMLYESDYDRDRIDVTVVDNASTDGSGHMVREEFPEVRLIVREQNCGVSGWNEGLVTAPGDYVLALDDDCYLPPDGLRRAVEAAREQEADLVSFKVLSTHDPEHVFTDGYRTGLFTFWGCAVLMSRPAVQALGGYDPEIFVWANELEFTMRFFDKGFRHLHLPEVAAWHMKALGDPESRMEERGYRINARHFAYIAAKLMHPRDAAEAFMALLAQNVRDGLRKDRVAFKALPDTVRGFIHGLRHREPLRNAELSHFYRHNFETFASPWWLSRPPSQLIRELPRELIRGRREKVGRWDEFFESRNTFYPDQPQTLQFSPSKSP